MKTSKLVLTGLLTLGIVGSSAYATTYARFNGSTAFRAKTVQSIIDVLSTNGYTVAADGADPTAATNAIFSGTLTISSVATPVIIKTHWSGSESGIQLVAQNGVAVAGTFIPDSVLSSGSATVVAAGLKTVPSVYVYTGALSDTTVPDVAMSDTLQATSQFNSNAKIPLSGGTATYALLTQAGGYSTGVGIVPFIWIASNGGSLGSSGTMLNMTNKLVNGLYSASALLTPSLPLQQWTGLASDSNVRVYAIGRNPDSGTRLSAFAESGLGALGKVCQYQPQDSGGNLVKSTGTAVYQINEWPAETVNGISVVAANSGYSSGGDMSKAFYGSTAATIGANGETGIIMVSYISVPDAATAISGAAKALTWNGVAGVTVTGGVATLNTAAIQNGSYSFWSYEHMYYRSGAASAPIADQVATDIHDVTSSPLLSTMTVSKTSDGAPPLGPLN